MLEQDQKIEPYAPTLKRPTGCDTLSGIMSLINERTTYHSVFSIKVKPELFIQTKLF